MKKLLLLFILWSTVLSSCKKTEIYEKVMFSSLGNEEIGYCGTIIEVNGDINLKPVEVPDDIIDYGGQLYWVKLKYLNKKIICKDGRPDPMPGEDSPEIELEEVRILDIRKID